MAHDASQSLSTSSPYHAAANDPVVRRHALAFSDLVGDLAPPDRPHAVHVFAALELAIQAAQALGALPGHLSVEPPTADRLTPLGSTRLSAFRRASRNPGWWLLASIGALSSRPTGRACQIALACLAVHVFVHAVGGAVLSYATVQRLRRQMRLGASDGVLADSGDRALAGARQRLDRVIEAHPRAAVRFGLTMRSRATERGEPVQHLRRAIQVQRASERRFADARQRAGAPISNALTEHQLSTVGAQLVAGVVAGDLPSIWFALCVEVALQPRVVQDLPCVWGTPRGEAAAWIDLDDGTYHERLFEVDAAGRRPPAGTAHLYTSARQYRTRVLCTELRDALRRAIPGVASTAVTVASALGNCPVAQWHDSPLAPDGLGVVSLSRVVQSLPPMLLLRGHDRYAVALATGATWLVSEKRSFYGTVPGSRIDTCVADLHRLLSWSSAPRVCSDLYVGSSVEPTDDAIRQAWGYLVARAEHRLRVPPTEQSLLDALDAGAALFSFALALAFALRRAVTYGLQRSLMRADAIVINDKAVHAVERPVPVHRWARDLMAHWTAYGMHVATRLRSVQRGDLADVIERALCDPNAPAVFSVIGGEVQPAGHRTWAAWLPSSLRLVENFARHFWPRRLIEAGVSERVVELFLRHQVASLDAQRVAPDRPPADDARCLGAAIEQTVAALQLRWPHLGWIDHGHA